MCRCGQFCLLIVPYGIETRIFKDERLLVLLLIVPYGIETNKSVSNEPLRFPLLIVPYGIETVKHAAREQRGAAFNRTLWN